ncbi:hypothetical protein ACFJIW_04740 [Tahibacter sp. UC22_41]|uniref:hypothetical protein n=1 Tax=Tahibacter sp. UC22_41 TaxID=3350178 RepID=UPI0036D8EE10
MRDPLDRPFSRRLIEQQPRIRDDFPETGRLALVHALLGFEAKRYVKSMADVYRETCRIRRKQISTLDDIDEKQLPSRVEFALIDMDWPLVFNFCERLYLVLAVPTEEDGYSPQYGPPGLSLDAVRLEIQKEVQYIFEEENLDYDFVNGKVVRASTTHTANLIGKAGVALADPNLSEARDHFRKAQNFFKDRDRPDYRNAAKEAVCAVEAAAKRLFPGDGSTLDDVIKRLQRDKILDPTIAKSFTGIYGFRNSGKGVSHGEGSGGEATAAIAEFVLDSAASQILLLVALQAEQDTEVPF